MRTTNVIRIFASGGERGSTTHHFTEYQNIANPRKTWILGFGVICYCVTKYHFSGQIRVQNRVQ